MYLEVSLKSNHIQVVGSDPKIDGGIAYIPIDKSCTLDHIWHPDESVVPNDPEVLDDELLSLSLVPEPAVPLHLLMKVCCQSVDEAL